MPLKCVDTSVEAFTRFLRWPCGDSGINQIDDVTTAGIWSLTSANPKDKKSEIETY